MSSQSSLLVFGLVLPLSVSATWLLGVRWRIGDLGFLAAGCALVSVSYPSSRMTYQGLEHSVFDSTSGDRLVALAFWLLIAMLLVAIWTVVHRGSAVVILRVVARHAVISFSSAVGLPLTLAAFVLVLLSQDAWTVASQLPGRSVWAVTAFAIACSWVLHRAGSPLSPFERVLVMLVVGTISYFVFLTSARALIDDAVAGQWLGVNLDLLYDAELKEFYADDEAFATLNTARENLALIFTALALITVVDAGRNASEPRRAAPGASPTPSG